MLAGAGRRVRRTGPTPSRRCSRSAARSGLTLHVPRGRERGPWHPGRCAELLLDGARVGLAGELHPRVVAALGAARAHLRRRGEPRRARRRGGRARARCRRRSCRTTRRPASTSRSSSTTACPPPTSRRRCARAPARCSRRCGCSTSTPVRRWGRARRSLAYALRFRAPDRTLTDVEVLAARDAAVAEAGRAGRRRAARRREPTSPLVTGGGRGLGRDGIRGALTTAAGPSPSPAATPASLDAGRRVRGGRARPARRRDRLAADVQAAVAATPRRARTARPAGGQRRPVRRRRAGSGRPTRTTWWRDVEVNLRGPAARAVGGAAGRWSPAGPAASSSLGQRLRHRADARPASAYADVQGGRDAPRRRPWPASWAAPASSCSSVSPGLVPDRHDARLPARASCALHPDLRGAGRREAWSPPAVVAGLVAPDRRGRARRARADASSAAHRLTQDRGATARAATDRRHRSGSCRLRRLHSHAAACMVVPHGADGSGRGRQRVRGRRAAAPAARPPRARVGPRRRRQQRRARR